MDTYLTVTGNLTADPEPRNTANGVGLGAFRVASNTRRFDKAAGEYKDGDPLYINVTCWRTMSVNVAASLRKGDSVIVTNFKGGRDAAEHLLEMGHRLVATLAELGAFVRVPGARLLHQAELLGGIDELADPVDAGGRSVLQGAGRVRDAGTSALARQRARGVGRPACAGVVAGGPRSERAAPEHGVDHRVNGLE